jgi:hypothetical protein
MDQTMLDRPTLDSFDTREAPERALAQGGYRWT